MAKAKATRTVHPLHFEDLEPHRFEDLIRQLIYDFRQWRSLEAIGRSGSDEGIDIRGIESFQRPDYIEEPEFDDEGETVRDILPQEREWIIQCKRERRIGPNKVRSIVSAYLSQAEEAPYGYILAAACDFSKAARDAFRQVVLEYGVEDFHIWGKAEIEDQLFLPRNDHLLFAYFGISLQVRRRSAKTLLRSRLATKRKLVKELGEIGQSGYKAVLIRDPGDDDYPDIISVEDFIEIPRWRYWQFFAHQPRDHVAFVFRKHYAYVNWNTKEYDILADHDAGVPAGPDLFGLERKWWDPNSLGEVYNAYWDRNVPKENRAWAIELRWIHYDRILAFDEIGDAYNEAPHLLVDYRADGNPFEPRIHYFLKSAQRYSTTSMVPDDGTRVQFFPDEIPDEREAYYEERQSILDT